MNIDYFLTSKQQNLSYIREENKVYQYNIASIERWHYYDPMVGKWVCFRICLTVEYNKKKITDTSCLLGLTRHELIWIRGTHLRPVHMTSYVLVRPVQLVVHTVRQINEINVREHRNWQHRIHKTKTKTKKQHNMC